MNIINTISKSQFKALDHAYRLYKRKVKADTEACFRETEESIGALDKASAERSKSHTEWLDILIAVKKSIGLGPGLAIEIALDYKRNPTPTFQAKIHNNIKEKRTHKRDPYSVFDLIEEPLTPCPDADAYFDESARQFNPFYSYSLSQAIDAELNGTVKMYSHIIDVMRTNGKGFVITASKQPVKLP